jgi:hypothetical protein
MERQLPFSSSWIQKPFSIRRFLIKHDLWLSILGAGLVLLTFIYKDARRDDAKDIMSALESANTQFVIRSDLHDAHAQTGLILSTLGEIQNGLDPEILSAKGRRLIFVARIVEVQGGTSDLRGRLDIMRDLAEKMPDTKGYVAKVDKLIKDWEKLTAQFDSVSEEYDYDKLPTSKGNAKATQDLDVADKALFALGHNIVGLEQELLENAKVTAKYEEQQYRRFTFISNWTFGIGWFLGLIGKVAGAPTGSSSET